MGLIQRIFGGGTTSGVGGVSQQFHESETTAEPAVRSSNANAPRRELIQVMLRDTMRKHGVPSDWIDCRILSVVTRQQQSGMHVQFIVRKADDQLLNYVHAFQESFWKEIEKFEPKAREWLFSVAWQFDGAAIRSFNPMPDPGAWADDPDTQPPEAGDTQPPDDDGEALQTDLQALYAIRDAAISRPKGPGNT